jgi:hypothetical protein
MVSFTSRLHPCRCNAAQVGRLDEVAVTRADISVMALVTIS